MSIHVPTIHVLVICSLLQVVASYRMVCVYTNWSQYRPDKGKFLPENVDPSLCTHLIYVYAKLKGNQLEPSEWNDDSTPWMEGMYSRVNSLKQINPDLKTLLGVGGWKMGSKDFSRMVARKKSRELFVRTATEFLRDRNFDGLAVDWQYPTQRGGRRMDRKNFSLLLKEIKEAFERESVETGSPKLLLVAGVGASKHIVDSAYEVDKVSNYTDFLNVMAYDLHGSWDNFTGHPSPLFPRKDETGPQAENNVDTLVKYWVSKGADPSKLVLGISTYGRTFTLKTKKFNGYAVPVLGPGDAGDYTKQEGMLAFYERCSLYFDATRIWDNYSKVPYWYSGQHWIGGEDVESIREKVNWIYTNKLGGMMIWSMDTDDYEGLFCGDGDFPLISAATDQFAAPVEITRPIGVKNETVATKDKTKTSSAVLDSAEKIISNKQKTVRKTNSKALSKSLIKSRQQDSNDLNVKSKEELKTKVESKQAPGRDKTLIDGSTVDAAAKEIISSENKKDTKVANKKQTQNVAKTKGVDNLGGTGQAKNKSLMEKAANSIERSINPTKMSPKEVTKINITKAKSRKRSKPTRKKKQPQTGRRRKHWRRRRLPVRRRRIRNGRKLNNRNKANSLKASKSKSAEKKQSSGKATKPTTIIPQSSTNNTGA